MLTPAVRLAIGAAVTAAVLVAVIAYPTTTSPTPAAPAAPVAAVQLQPPGPGHHYDGRGRVARGGR